MSDGKTAAPPVPDHAPTGLSRREFVGTAAGAAALLATKPVFAGGSTTPVYRIHPAIGIARVGNADPSTFFIGPEAPGFGPLGDAPGTAAPNYKSDDGRVKPQGARFRVFEYAPGANGKLVPVREVTLATPGVSAIRWNVHLANKKASFHRFEGPAGESAPPGALRNATVADRSSLEIDFGARSISGASAAPVTFAPGGSTNPAAETWPKMLSSPSTPVIDYLGQLRTDAAGRLIVLGGQGKARYWTDTPPALGSYANNDGWFDDSSDGPVTATVTVDLGKGPQDISVDPTGGAWVLCTPPDFAPQIRGAVTGYDLMLDLAVRSIPVPSNNGLYDPGQPLGFVREMQAQFSPGADFELPTYVPDFVNDIQPVLLMAYNYWYVDALVTHKHNSLLDPTLGNPDPAYAKNRQGVVVYLNPPDPVVGPTGPQTMPHLKGDNPYVGTLKGEKYLTLTRVQYAMMRTWAYRGFNPGSPQTVPAITPWGLDRAALENTSGGAFFPGIELGWQARNPALFAEPFRLNLAATSQYLGESQTIGPGHFTRQMALPWHADFNDCRNEGDYGWWPHQRPNDVLPTVNDTARVDWARPTVKFDSGGLVSTHADMIQNWFKFGFVLDEGDLYVEAERAAQIP